MADLISRLKLESGEFDSKIARATKGLLTMEKECRSVGGTLAILEKDQLEFVKGLGQMETVSQDARGKIGELTKAFTELSVQYNRLTKEEKNGDYGRALASSLDQLKNRIKGAKSELSGIEGKLSGFGDTAKNMASKLGLPVEQLAKFGPYGAAAAAALKVAKDAFMATEGNIDAWGQAVEGAKGAYSVFLDTLNNGNWSNFFTNLNTAISGASKLYDEMDRLSSIKANNAAAIAKEQATIQELRLRQQKGENVAKELREAEERLRNLQMQSVDQGKIVGKEQMRQAIQNSVNSIKGNGGLFRKDTTAKVSENQIDAAIDEILDNGQAAMDKYAQAFKDLQAKGTKTWTETQYSQGGVAYQVTKKEFDINKLSEEEQALYKLSKAITDTEAKLSEGINTYAQALQEGASSTREATMTEKTAKRGEKEISTAAAKAAEPQTKAQEKVDKALEDYATTMNIAAIRKEAGLDDEEKYKEKELAAKERLFDAYTEAYNLYADPKYKEAFDKAASEILDLAKVVKDLKDEKERQKQADQELKRAEQEAARQMKQLDSSILSGLTSTAKKAGWTSKELGTEGIKTKINAGIDITDDEWKALQDKLNERLKSLGMDPIRIDFETGNIETVIDKTKQKFEEMMSTMESGVSAISTIGNAFNELKGIGEDLSEAFSGNMNAWDAMMTVFNSGISILQTVMGVMEAINTLTEIGAALKEKNAIAQAAETTSVVTGKGAEAAAEMTETGVAATNTGAKMAEAAAGAGSAMSGIPIVGPILAVAAIAAVLAAVIASVAKAKSAAPKYAMGGIVPGNSMSGDNVPAFVNSGELILSKSQQNTLAGNLQSNPMGNMRLSTEISGSNLRVVLNNDNRSRGGSRDVYGVH